MSDGESHEGGGERFAGGVGSLLKRLDPRDGPSLTFFVLLSAVLAAGFYASFIFRPDQMLFGTDMIDQAYQLREFGLREVRAGRGLPLWNPYVYGGLPYLAILPGPVFYPTTLLYLLLPLFRAIGWTFVLHTFLAGVLGYAAGRSFGLRRWASATTGLAFMFTGYMVSMLYGGHDGRMFAMVLIPAAFACLERGLRDRTLAPYLLLGVVVALQIFTPHVQMMYYSSLAVALYALVRLVGRWRADERRAAWRGAGRFTLAFIVAALLGAVQLLPTIELLPDAVRGAPGAEGYDFAASWALPPQELSALFLPDLIGSLQELYWGSNPFKLHTEYLGAVPLALAVVGVAGAGRRDTRTWFFAGASLLGILFALGAATPVHRIAYEVVPIVGRFRAPSMMLAPVSFFVALLAGIGCQRIMDAGGWTAGREAASGSGRASGGEGGLPWMWIWALSAPFLLLALGALLAPEGLARWVRNAWFEPGWRRSASPELLGMLRVTGGTVLTFWAATLAIGQGIARRRVPAWGFGLVLVLMVVDLWRVDVRYLETVDPDRVFEAGPAITSMRAELDPGERVWPLEGSFGPNELMHHEIAAITGSQNFRLAWYERLVGGAGFENLLRHPVLWPLFDLRYLTTRSELDVPLLHPPRRVGAVALNELRMNPPHAFFPTEVRTAADTAEAVRQTLELPDPRLRAIVEPETRGASDRPAGEAPPAGAGTARLERHHPGRIALTVSADRAGLLFVSEIHHPNWRAVLEGENGDDGEEELGTLRTNAAFLGVVVPEGDHRVRLEFRSRAYLVGRILSLAAALGVAAGLLVPWLRRRNRRPDGRTPAGGRPG